MNPTEIILAAITLVSVLVPVILVHLRGSRADKIAAEKEATGKIYSGYDDLLKHKDELLKFKQEDILDLRSQVAELKKEIKELREIITTLQKQLDHE